MVFGTWKGTTEKDFFFLEKWFVYTECEATDWNHAPSGKYNRFVQSKTFFILMGCFWSFSAATDIKASFFAVWTVHCFVF